MNYVKIRNHYVIFAGMFLVLRGWSGLPLNNSRNACILNVNPKYLGYQVQRFSVQS